MFSSPHDCRVVVAVYFFLDSECKHVTASHSRCPPVVQKRRCCPRLVLVWPIPVVRKLSARRARKCWKMPRRWLCFKRNESSRRQGLSSVLFSCLWACSASSKLPLTVPVLCRLKVRVPHWRGINYNEEIPFQRHVPAGLWTALVVPSRQCATVCPKLVLWRDLHCPPRRFL